MENTRICRLAEWVCKAALVAAALALWGYIVWQFPAALDRELAMREARTAQYLEWLRQERAKNGIYD